MVRPLRILLAEDDASISRLLAEMLDDMGHSVSSVETTEAGTVEASLRDRPDLMLVDLRLREGTGSGAIETIQRTAAIPAILMSGERLSARQDHAIKLQKPFMYRDLANAIERAIAMLTLRSS